MPDCAPLHVSVACRTMRIRGQRHNPRPSRRHAPCRKLRYPARMDTLRKQLGEHVRVTREADGYRSRDALAEAANIGVRSVAAVERGEQAGRKVLTAIERALGWPTGSITAYLEGTADLPAAPVAEPSTAARHEWSADERRKILA